MRNEIKIAWNEWFADEPDGHVHPGKIFEAGWLASEKANERRRLILITAVTVCMNDDHLTDLETLKRAWFYSETGRDEPVGSRTWEQLRVMVREHEADFKSEPV